MAGLNEKQVAILRLAASGRADAGTSNPERVTARSLATKRLLRIRGRGAQWHAELTEAGRYYLDHGTFPPDHIRS